MEQEQLEAPPVEQDQLEAPPLDEGKPNQQRESPPADPLDLFNLDGL